MKQQKIHWTPLAIIALFAGLVDSALVIVIPQTEGGIQIALMVFAFILTFAIVGAFFFFLWKKPHLLYSPNEWGETPKFQEFVETLSGLSPKQSDSEKEKEKKIEVSEIVQETVPEPIKEEQSGDEFDWMTPYSEGKYPEARRVLQKALTIAEGRAQIIFLRTMSAVTLSYVNLYDGIAEYEKLIEEFPNDIQPYRSFARIYERSAEYPKAIEVINRGINHVAKDDKLLLKLEKLHYLLEWGKPELMNDIKTLALEIVKTAKDPRQVATAYRSLGLYFARQNMPDKSRKALFNAFESARADTGNLEEIANCFRDEIKDFKTELYFRLLLVDLMPNDESSLVLLGNCHYILNQHDLAYMYYMKASQASADPGAWVFGNMGNLYNTVGLFTLGINTLEQALKLSPNDVYSHERIGNAIANSKKMRDEVDNTIRLIKLEILGIDDSFDDVTSNSSQ